MHRRHALIAALAATSLLLACGDDPPSPGASGTPPEVRDPVGEPKVVPTADEPASAGLGTPVAAPVAPEAPKTSRLADRILRFVASRAKREAAFVEEYKARFQAQLNKLRWFKRLSTEAYAERGYRLAFSDGNQLGEAAKLMLQTLAELETHGLDPSRYEREAVQATLDALVETQKTYQALVDGVTDAKEQAIWKVLQGLGGQTSITESALASVLTAHDLSDADLPVMDRVDKHMEAMFAAKASVNDAFVAIDIALAGAYFRYAFEMRYLRLAHPFQADASYGKGLERSADALLARFGRTDFTRFGEALADVAPKLPEYQRLREGLTRYRALARDVEQVKLSRAARYLKPGKSGDKVVKLQERLAQEGYYDGPVDGEYDEDVAKAVLLYQETHQLKADEGAMTFSSVKSMNKPFAERVQEIELGLQRHRESELHQTEKWAFGVAPVQVRVNIPAFEAVFYREGKPVRTQRVVVGANALEVHEDTGMKGWFNRTRLFSEEMKTVVLNPKWRVPPRIKEQELDRELLKEPDYYEKHGYEVRILDNGKEEVVQLPGPNNALGLVKFLFPNQFSIYMHDTPKKRLFGRPIRAFSHGCMRVDGAVDLARWILTEVEQMPVSKFERIMAKRETYGVRLETRIPITIDYNTVGVHSSGHVMFLTDVYRFDRDYRDGKTPYRRYTHRGMEQVVIKE